MIESTAADRASMNIHVCGVSAQVIGYARFGNDEATVMRNSVDGQVFTINSTGEVRFSHLRSMVHSPPEYREE